MRLGRWSSRLGRSPRSSWVQGLTAIAPRRAAWPRAPVPVRYVVLPRYVPRARTALEPLARSDALRQLLEHPNYGLTLWWAVTQLPDEELEWLYATLELELHADGPTADGTSYAGRTFYDIKGFRSFLARRK